MERGGDTMLGLLVCGGGEIKRLGVRRVEKLLAEADASATLSIGAALLNVIICFRGRARSGELCGGQRR